MASPANRTEERQGGQGHQIPGSHDLGLWDGPGECVPVLSWEQFLHQPMGKHNDAPYASTAGTMQVWRSIGGSPWLCIF